MKIKTEFDARLDTLIKPYVDYWKLLKNYVKDFEDANNSKFSNAAWDRIKQLEKDIRTSARAELQYQVALESETRDKRIQELEAEVMQLKTERESTLDRLKSWGIPTNPSENDPVLVMAITAANDPKSNVFICENLHELYHSLDVIFFDGDDTRNFDDFWDEGCGVDIRFKRMSRKELDELMNDEDSEWEGF